MNSLVLVVFAAVAAAATNQEYYNQVPDGYYEVQEPDRYYQLPPRYSGPGLYGKGNNKYFAGERLSQDHYTGDVLRKNVQDIQGSGLESTREAGGKHLINVNTAGEQGYAQKSGARGSSDSGLVVSGKTQEFGAAGKGGYGGYGTAGYKKGHSNTGFHKSYTNVESGKDSKFVDSEHKEGGETFDRSFGDMFGHAGSDGYERVAHGSGSQLAAEGHGAARSGLQSIGSHDVMYGQHGRDGAYQGLDSRLAKEHKGIYQGQSHLTGQHNIMPTYYY